jgi:hypothetical protein
MAQSGRMPLLIIDIAGGAILSVCVLVASWLVAVRHDEADFDITKYKRLIQIAQEDIAGLQAGCDQQL